MDRYTSSLLEQIGMRAGTHEHDQVMFPVVIEFVGQQKIAAEWHSRCPSQSPPKWVIKPLRPKRGIVDGEIQTKKREDLRK